MPWIELPQIFRLILKSIDMCKLLYRSVKLAAILCCSFLAPSKFRRKPHIRSKLSQDILSMFADDLMFCRYLKRKIYKRGIQEWKSQLYIMIHRNYIISIKIPFIYLQQSRQALFIDIKRVFMSLISAKYLLRAKP